MPLQLNYEPNTLDVQSRYIQNNAVAQIIEMMNWTRNVYKMATMVEVTTGHKQCNELAFVANMAYA